MNILSNIIKEIEGKVKALIKESTITSLQRADSYCNYNMSYMNNETLKELRRYSSFVYSHLIRKITEYGLVINFILEINDLTQLEQCLKELNMEHLAKNLNDNDKLLIDDYLKANPTEINVHVCSYFNDDFLK